MSSVAGAGVVWLTLTTPTCPDRSHRGPPLSVGQMSVNSLAKRLRLSAFSKDSKLSGELAEGRTDVPEYVKAAAGVQDVKVTLVKSSTSIPSLSLRKRH